MNDTNRIYNNPRENIGYGALNYGGMPLEDILYKQEETDMGVADYSDKLDGDELEVDSYMRDIITDRFRTEPLMNADEEPTRNYVENSGVLNLRFNGHRGTGDPNPNHQEMFMGFMDVNQNGADYQAPRFDTETARAHTTIRARNTRMDLHDSNVDRVPESDWQPAQISFAKKDMQRWFQNIYNGWHLPSFVNFSKSHFSSNRLQDNINKKMIMDEYKQHLDATGPDVMDQYGRILSNHTGYSWYTLPYMQHTMPYGVESTMQPKAVIMANDPSSKGLYYSDATFSSEETTNRLPMTQMRFSEYQLSKVKNTTTQAESDGVISRHTPATKPAEDLTRAKNFTEQTAPQTESMTIRGQKGARPLSDYTKQNFKATSKFDDPLFGGALSYSSNKLNHDGRKILSKTENTTVDGIENQRTNDRRSQLRRNADKKFGVQEGTQATGDAVVRQNYRGQTLRVKQSAFDNKEFGELHDEILSRPEGRGRGNMGTPMSRAVGALENREMTDSTDPMMRIKNNNDAWVHKGKMQNARASDINETFNTADSRERVVGLGAGSFDPYAKARNLNKYDVVNLEERF